MSDRKKPKQRRTETPKLENSDRNYRKLEDANHCIRLDLDSVDQILRRIDPARGRTDAIKTYVHALRNLQHLHDHCNAGFETTQQLRRHNVQIE